MKKILTVLFVSIFFVAFSHQAQAYVEGVWSMDIVEKIKAKVKGVGKYKDTDYFSDNWEFHSDETFSIDGYEVGTWEIIGKKFYVDIDEAEMSDILEQNLIDNADFPLDTTVSIYVTQASGKQNKDGSIKAKYKFQAIVEADGFTGKLSVKGKATGIWISSSPTGGGGNGGSNGGGDTGTTYTISEYFPLGQGDTWTYYHDSDYYRTFTVSGTEAVDGVIAAKKVKDDGSYELWTSDSNGLTLYGAYEVEDCGWGVISVSPVGSFTPGTMSIGETHSGTGTLTYTKCTDAPMIGTISSVVTLEGTENVTVPAGTFNDCLKFSIVEIINK